MIKSMSLEEIKIQIEGASVMQERLPEQNYHDLDGKINENTKRNETVA